MTAHSPDPRASAPCASLILPIALALGVGACAPRSAPDSRDLMGLSRLDGSRWLWVAAECSDGSLPLDSLGYEGQLRVAVAPGSLRLTEDVQLLTQGCARTTVWAVVPNDDGDAEFRFIPQAEVILPPHDRCGASQETPTEGGLRVDGDTLEVVQHRSAWCRGFDVRFVYRRGSPELLSPPQLVARYVAHWNRRDADAVAALFADRGSLIEPFSATDDGNLKRHDGREAIRAWYRAAFDSTPWLAMRLTELDISPQQTEASASWQYMDAQLAEPIRGRNLFVITTGEIFETEVQLFDLPLEKPSGEATPSGDARAAGASP